MRRFVGDLRYDTPAQLKVLNQLYEVLHLYINFFLPVMKLREKVRVGSKTKRVYDKPQTPYARVLASPQVSAPSKAKLRATYRHRNLGKAGCNGRTHFFHSLNWTRQEVAKLAV